MKVVLAALNAKYIHSNLAVHNLKAMASAWKEHIEIAEFTINQYTDFILQNLYRKKPDILAFSCYIWNFEYIRELVIETAKVLPQTKIWLGGPEVSFDAADIMNNYPQLEGIMVGEGEQSFSYLMDCYLGGYITLSEIPGIVYRDDQRVVRSNQPIAPIDMDQIPFAYSDMDLFRNKIIYYETSRGCPFSCSYCLSSADKKLRFRSFEIVRQELQFFLDHEVPQVKFVDRTFNCNHRHAVQIWEYLKEHDNGITNFHFEISADLLNAEEMKLLSSMRPGLVQLEIGVQSTNEMVVQEIDRTMNFAKLREIVEEINSWRNIHQHLDLIAGLPYEDLESFKKSFNDVYLLYPEQLQLGFLKVLKGSKMHQLAEEYGIIYKQKPQYEVLFTKWLNYDQVLQLKGIEEMVEVYYNSGQFTHTLRYLEPVFSSPFEMFEVMRAYYEANDLFGISHTRIARYEILLEIIQRHDQERKDFFREVLLFDLYLRENLKKRPSFAPLSDEFRSEIWKYQREQKGRRLHIEVFHFDLKNSGEQGVFPVLFDYENRDSLTYEANTEILTF